MIDQKKIRMMTSLAIYDKHYGEKDRKIEGYYRTDYVYKKNCWTRICIGMGLFVLFLFYGFYIMFVKEVDFASINYKVTAEKWIIFVIAVLVFYTIVGTITAVREYEKADKRLKNYNKLLERLNILNEQNKME